MAGEVEEGAGRGQFLQKVNHMIGSIANNAVDIGMEHVDFNNLYIGEVEHEENGISFYPIFQGHNGPQVATILSWSNSSGNTTRQLEPYISAALLNSPPVADNNATKLYAMVPYSTTGKSLSVPTIAQGINNKLCWAACVSAVGMYRNYLYKTPLSIAQSVGKTEQSGGQLSDVTFALSTNYNIYARNGGTSYLSINSIMNNVNLGDPMIVEMATEYGGLRHAVTVSGYVYNGGLYDDYITYVDPDMNGATCTVSLTPGNSFEYTKNYSGYYATSLTQGYVY